MNLKYSIVLFSSQLNDGKQLPPAVACKVTTENVFFFFIKKKKASKRPETLFLESVLISLNGKSRLLGSCDQRPMPRCQKSAPAHIYPAADDITQRFR